ncbi:glucosamine-6-phosphate deaminase [Agrobacterium sp. Ap1]|jgi:glucosamine-6-phosphate deaminase|uniref:glucosamine-6-phosphate deaminase n=1 Tax=Rhizobium/Agrobacterium group TaxID=227290 RepID=UPI000FAB7079|nr:glucosamine-6-phosphate deaminase [Agrobacterium sp. Ap1]MBO0143344.1 glucosamine-6-phosphate deaminase [Agrobacterium sp. Ap1]
MAIRTNVATTKNFQTLTILPTAEDAADAVASHLLSQVRSKPDSVLGLATGQTPRRVYAKLIEAFEAGTVSFSKVRTFNLDEYCGLRGDHPDSFAAFMWRELFGGADFDPRNINLITGDAENGHLEAARYASQLKACSGVDVQLLGLGTNGHIGFNEPASARDSRLRVVELSAETLSANKPTLLQLAQVPSKAITMGVADILEAREIIMLATGPAKADAVRESLEGAPSTACPASLLQQHARIHWFLDEAAATQLSRT